MTDFDPVTKPRHYASGELQCIDAIHAALGDDGFVAYCRGTAMKYAWRAGKKEKHAEDLKKGAWYLNKAAEVLGEAEALIPVADFILSQKGATLDTMPTLADGVEATGCCSETVSGRHMWAQTFGGPGFYCTHCLVDMVINT